MSGGTGDTSGGALAQLLARARVVLLDFDGPVCAVYAGVPAPMVARRLAAALDLDADGTADPLLVLRQAASTRDRQSAARADAVLEAAELDAVDTAALTPGAVATLAACRRAGLPVAVVSNNSEAAIRRFLARHNLAQDVAVVVGRVPGRPDLMKPDPHLLRIALGALGAQPADAVLIGDSVTDVQAAHAAGVPAVGYANKPGKATTLTTAAADAIVTDMHAIALALDAASVPAARADAVSPAARRS